VKFSKIKDVTKVFTITLEHIKLSIISPIESMALKKSWSNRLLDHFKIELSIIGSPYSQDESLIFVGNHISYLDIPVIMAAEPKISFVSKKEVKYWPVIGVAASRAGTIFVNRGKKESRGAVKEQIANHLSKNIHRVVIFPSGTTAIHHSANWRKGAFEIAQSKNLKVQPFRIKYDPLEVVSYVGDDTFVTHLYELFKLNKIKATIEFHEPIFVSNPIEDCQRWKKWCEEVW
jgi:1-acyl-sn-glycerol-3-phosphate acyltransferase